MMTRKRVANLEARSADSGLSLMVRAWLGHDLTPAERISTIREAEQPVAVDLASMSKEDRAWLQV
jgi:hypothetical protein